MNNNYIKTLAIYSKLNLFNTVTICDEPWVLSENKINSCSFNISQKDIGEINKSGNNGLTIKIYHKNYEGLGMHFSD